MTTETMSVHKALAELKTLDSRINNAINNLDCVAAKKHSSAQVNGISIESYKKNADAAYKKATDLINRRNAIKRAVVLSNATTKVTVADMEYTVAEAIDMKNNGMDLLRDLLVKINTSYLSAQKTCNVSNGVTLETRADDYIKSLFGASDSKTQSDEIERARKTFIESQTFELIDPLDAVKIVETLNDQIDLFMTEVDSALSVSNAITNITITY